MIRSLLYNTTGITALLSHLFEEHDIRHCGIIRGPVGNIEAEERWQAFKAALGVHKREQDELLGEKAVMQKLSQPLLSAQFTIDTVKEMVSHHSNNGKKADDDVTMLAIRKLGIGKRKSKNYF